MATIRELLLQIPEHGEKAVFNAENQLGKEHLNKKKSKISNALIYAFHWYSSIEGYDFWRDIYHELRKNE